MSTITLPTAMSSATTPAASAVLTLGEVFDAHAGFVLRSVRRMGVREADAEDLAQEVFMVVHRNLGRYDGRATMRSWLFGIVLKVCSGHRRRARVRREVITDRPPERTNDYCDVEARDYARMLNRALGSLSEKQCAVFVLFELEGLSMKEVATAADIPLFTSYTRLRAARAKVREMLERSMTEATGD